MRPRGHLRMAVAACVIAAFATGLAGCSNDPYPPAEGKKILYGVLGEDPHGLDPVRAGDTLSGGIIAQIYDCLYEYHYLKRPYQLVPCLAETMPQVSEDGLVYTIPIKRGVYFQDDACFPGGKGREVTAQDCVYAIKRLADKGNKPRGWWLLDGKVVGLDEFHDASVTLPEGETMDYDGPVEAVQPALHLLHHVRHADLGEQVAGLRPELARLVQVAAREVDVAEVAVALGVTSAGP